MRYENTEAYVGCIADVIVDRKTGNVRVERLAIAHDCGLIVNPDGLRNQIEGNAIQATEPHAQRSTSLSIPAASRA